MIEDGPAPAHDKEALLYDYSKHLLSLALLGIGGIVTITQSPLGQRIPSKMVIVLIAAFACAGFAALTVTATILRARRLDQPISPGAWTASQAAMMFLGVGVGMFLTAWIAALL